MVYLRRDIRNQAQASKIDLLHALVHICIICRTHNALVTTHGPIRPAIFPLDPIGLACLEEELQQYLVLQIVDRLDRDAVAGGGTSVFSARAGFAKGVGATSRSAVIVGCAFATEDGIAAVVVAVLSDDFADLAVPPARKVTQIGMDADNLIFHCIEAHVRKARKATWDSAYKIIISNAVKSEKRWQIMATVSTNLQVALTQYK